MIETEQQRRWWFATHPEYSWSRKRGGLRFSKTEGNESSRVSSKAGDAGVDEQPSFWERLAANERELAPLVERYFGPQPNFRTRVLLAGGVFHSGYSISDVYRMIPPGGGGGLGGGAARGMGMRPPVGGGGSGPSGLRPPPAGGKGAPPAGGSKPPGRGGGSGPEDSRPPAGGPAPEPGEWVERCRSPIGLPWQSKMSGQPIIEKNGKYYIREYRVPSIPEPVYFDDYRDGVFFEFKGPHGKLLGKNKLFHEWVKGVQGARDQARRQVEAAQGLPVIWKVGADQVKAFEKALDGIAGIIILP